MTKNSAFASLQPFLQRVKLQGRTKSSETANVELSLPPKIRLGNLNERGDFDVTSFGSASDNFLLQRNPADL